MPSKIPVVGKPAIPKGSARHEGPSKLAFLNLANGVRSELARRARIPAESAQTKKLGDMLANASA